MLCCAAASVFAVLISSKATEATCSWKQCKLDVFLYAVWDALSYMVGDESAALITKDKSSRSNQPFGGVVITLPCPFSKVR
jgi:hypothetical protein